jgi:uroporphyrinogen-III synthase
MVSPLFTIRSVDWDTPEPAAFDALMLTSANAAAEAGPALLRYDALPCYCVGETTASAARRSGLDRIRLGPSDGAALLVLMAGDGVRSALHLCGRDHLAVDHLGISIERRIVYTAEAADRLAPDAVAALPAGALPLIHSPRAGSVFAGLVDQAGLDRESICVLAISAAAARAVGPGWRAVRNAPAPRDQALLELAAKLCQTARMGGADGNE